MAFEDIVPILNGVGKLAEHPLIAWVLIMSVLMIDEGLIKPLTPLGWLTGKGLISSLLSFILGFLIPNFQVTNVQLMILITLFPVVAFALDKSKSVGR